jgi:hypothetical protein
VNFTDRQTTLLTVAITNFYDEIAKTSTPKMKEEVMELAKLVQDYATENHK